MNLENYDLSNVLLSIGDGVIAHNERWEIEFLNQPLLDIYGDQVGKHCFEIFFDRDCPCEEGNCPIEQIFKKGKSSFQQVKKDKYGNWLEITSVPAHPKTKEAEQKTSSIISLVRNVTKRMNLEEELRVRNMELKLKNTELENFVYTVSHDLKSPLVSLQGLAGALLEDYSDRLDEQGREFLLDIKNSVNRLGLLVRDLLDLSRIGRGQNRREDVPAKKIIQEAIDKLKLPLKEKGIQLIIDEDMPIIFCDKEMIVLALVNLLNNAIKFMGEHNEHPRIAIGHTIKDDYHVFFVQDNGIGIERKYHQKIFDIFQTLNEVKDPNSTGVGLTIVKRIIEGHKGRVWVESEKGQGSTFYFSIPIKKLG
ncbi:MAG: GHKL domain-containing protein [bacterium]|nr:GHKL domain-containing protein [bacterium]